MAAQSSFLSDCRLKETVAVSSQGWSWWDCSWLSLEVQLLSQPALFASGHYSLLEINQSKILGVEFAYCGHSLATSCISLAFHAPSPVGLTVWKEK